MPKDYKNRNNTEQEKSPFPGRRLSFLSGLSIGLLTAFFVFLYYQLPTPALSGNPEPKKEEEAQAEAQALNEPTFTFYQILPNKEMKVSEWATEDESSQEPVNKPKTNVYILQVGLFRDYQSADEIKARLALMGISAEIQSISLDGAGRTNPRPGGSPYPPQGETIE